MLIDQLLYPVKALGPGNRIAIWTVGCNHHCKGCSNPELWKPNGQQSISPKDIFFTILRISKEAKIDGITITGGEPFDQVEDLLELVRYLKNVTSDILIFSGYPHEDLLSHPKAVAVMENIAVLVDGPYREELNFSLPLRGSSNQRVLLFDRSLKERYDSYLATAEKRIQNFYFNDQAVSVGIHDVNFKDDLNELLKEMKVRQTADGGSKMAQGNRYFLTN